ncbi:hypothetical protein [Streptomyces sp. NPDC057747]
MEHTSVFDDTGHLTVSVPAGLAPDGLPCAVRLVAPHHREDLVRAAARTIETARGPLGPPVSAG